MSKLFPHGRPAPGESRDAYLSVFPHAIETAVAKGLGLSRQHLAAIHDPDRSDRYGIWRYFAAQDEAMDVFRAALSDMTHT